MCCRLSVKPLKSRDKPCVNSRGPALLSPDSGGLEDPCGRRLAAFFSLIRMQQASKLCYVACHEFACLAYVVERGKKDN